MYTTKVYEATGRSMQVAVMAERIGQDGRTWVMHEREKKNVRGDVRSISEK